MHDVSKKQSSQPLNDQAVLTRMTLSTTPGGGGSLGAGLVAVVPVFWRHSPAMASILQTVISKGIYSLKVGSLLELETKIYRILREVLQS